ncbi:hypothetical protein OGR47_06230 [Methylocystis sp. MJC1]|jgi:mono/diheme cytochrome c family protein|uniref:hypothetical protein n=1 Tax=Methylocystis sp. MJC1 TaxID=2654282 RepID=UPI001FEE3B49|nr:hypothetical protein [Methylocystis sp. MJC1]KAF2992630.1 hypothetical protein MJC1_00208 [Methylocystis sp. MJC1]UZX13042.1 hypothetical protein OGR47_06230 [Methylocystis sp. MJC1]
MHSNHFHGFRACVACSVIALAAAASTPTLAAKLRHAHPALALSATSPGAPLSADDVSWLFPPPKNSADLANTIAIADLTAPDPKDASKREAIWPASAFAQFLANADGPSTQIGSHHLQLPKEAHDIKVWRVAGLRIDPGAPGLTNDVIAQFGQSPQVRFILQPVTTQAKGAVKVHDVTAHLVYTFAAGADAPAEQGCLPRVKPDTDAFKKIARDFAGLRDDLANGRFGGAAITTQGKLLGVHPGLADRRTAKSLRDALVTVLERHLTGAKLSAMAVMGLADNGPEPWVFLAMSPVGPGVVPSLPNGGFIPVRGPALDGKQFAEALAVLEKPHQVIPTPAPNNLNPITCKNAALPEGEAALPVAQRKGLATAELFDLGDAKISNPATIKKIQDTVDLVADPARSHFFNTDCVSCHTDTRRTMDLLKNAKIPGVDPAVLPQEKWNVRNFGWFPSFLRPGKLEATATRRAASETAAVVDFINANGLAKP